MEIIELTGYTVEEKLRVPAETEHFAAVRTDVVSEINVDGAEPVSRVDGELRALVLDSADVGHEALEPGVVRNQLRVQQVVRSFPVSIECERHAVLRRFRLGEVTPCHSASIRFMDSGVSGGMPYFSK